MSEAAAKVKQCELCLESFEPDRPEKRICDVCMGGHSAGYERLPDIDLRNCQDCGQEFTPWLMGNGINRSTCKPCVVNKRLETARKNGTLSRKLASRPKNPPKPEPKIEPAPFVLTPGKPFDVVAALKRRLNGNMVLLDFSSVPEVLAWLKEHRPDLQAYFMGKVFYDIPAEVFKNWMLDRAKSA